MTTTPFDAPPLPSHDELEIERLGPCEVPTTVGPHHEPFVDNEDRVLCLSRTAELNQILAEGREPPSFERAGARKKLFFDPKKLKAGILTCGGLCPGLNNVIRSLVLQLHYAYGVKRTIGFRFGYAGLRKEPLAPPVELTPSVVAHLHERGGTMLASSRGKQDLDEMVDTLVREDIGLLFVIGGDGGLTGARDISRRVKERGLTISIIGMPKTIDNDLQWTWRSFGFSTAVAAASEVILAAHSEALGAWNGVGLVKLMGRHAGFIAAHATLACNDVNFCLIPEVPFRLEGENGFLTALEKRLAEKDHAVVVVAEGAGQYLFSDHTETGHDPSGNVVLRDIGVFLRDRINEHLTQKNLASSVKYIDPSYIIRSLPANAFDSQLCLLLGQHAVHAGMAGRTSMVVGQWNQQFTHIPLDLAVGSRRRINPHGDLWRSVIETTGQPVDMI